MNRYFILTWVAMLGGCLDATELPGADAALSDSALVDGAAEDLDARRTDLALAPDPVPDAGAAADGSGLDAVVMAPLLDAAAPSGPADAEPIDLDEGLSLDAALLGDASPAPPLPDAMPVEADVFIEADAWVDAQPDAAPEVDAQPDAAPEVDAQPDAAVLRCEPASGQCPDPPVEDLEEGGGLALLPECDYRLEDVNEWAEKDAAIDALTRRLPVVGVEGVMRDLNRNTEGLGVIIRGRVGHLERGFRWNDGDNDVRYWYPQGITGSADAYAAGTIDQRQALAVSWYFKVDRAPGNIEKGVRISFADVTNLGNVTYRHTLLVEPYLEGDRPNFRPVVNHAGGIVWYHDYLYVADTRVGFRVFDLSRIMRVRTGEDRIGYHPPTGEYDAFNYRYIIPQIGTYRLRDDSCRAKFSFVALDRSTSPHSLLSGEYHVDRIDGRLLRWALDEETGRLEGVQDIPAVEAFAAGHTRMQGALSWRGQYFLNCSSQLAVFGRMYRTAPGRESVTFAGPDGPEDLYYDPTLERLWSHTEDEGDRNVYFSDMDSLN